MKLRGKDILVFAKIADSWKTFAYGTTCEIDVKVKQLELAPDGRWRRYMVAGYSWGGTTTHLLSDIAATADGMQLVQQVEEVRIMFGSVEATDSARDFKTVLPDGRFGLKGMAHVNRMTVTGVQRNKATLSLSFAGTGELESIFSDGLFMPADADAFEFADGGLFYITDVNLN